jgi:pimeloyl-ACP methyl ester carboxylesterase
MTTALLVPGSASTGDFVARAFAPLLTDVTDLITVADRTGRAAAISGALERAAADVRSRGEQLAAVIGVSIGAHAAALWASGHPKPTDPGLLVLAMPAWTGPPGPTAAFTMAAVERIASRGIAAELADLQRDFGGDWVVTELVAAWSSADESDLLASLSGTATSPAPTLAELAAIRAPTVVLALADDPMHPVEVARTWSTAIPGAALAQVGRFEPARDVGVFGRRTLAAPKR